MSWWVRYGRWWAVQFDPRSPFSLGFHFDHHSYETLVEDSRGRPIRFYGPYLDLHLPFLIVSVGRHPILTPWQGARAYQRGGIKTARIFGSRRRLGVLVRAVLLAALAIGLKRLLLLHPPLSVAVATSAIDVLIIGLAVFFVGSLE